MLLQEFIQIVQPFSMTSIERITELYNSLEYIRINNISGDIVECGVWKGGNILGILRYLEYHNMQKLVWAYDTFEGMTPPEDCDVDYNNIPANQQMSIPHVLAKSPLEEVKCNICYQHYENVLKLVIGDVSQTLLNNVNIPDSISILRLDTDWYASTLDELKYLYPKVCNGGVLIVDDYGHWQGSKKAVQEYFHGQTVVINHIDYTGIKIIKGANL